MNTEEIKLTVSVYDSIAELPAEYARLLSGARETTQYAYAPYSNFKVGAFARLVNGHTVRGANQENASFPAGICAERTLLSAAASLYPGVGIDTIAISYDNLNGPSNKPVSPCGICRQSLIEYQELTKNPIRLVLGGMEGRVQVIENAASLLPLVFTASDMEKGAPV